MGRPPSNGAPAFRFNTTEVAQMEAILREHQGQVPTREFLVALAEKFSNSPERVGKSTVQMKQLWNWFQNRRYALRSKLVKSPGQLHISPTPREGSTPVRNLPATPQQTVSSGHNMARSAPETPQMEFEAKSARDGAWYDVQAFLSHRYLETGNPEVLVRFAGFGSEEDEWINVHKHVRHRSLPCEASECVAVLAGDLILCFQEGKEQALYFDAHILDAQRRRHDIRGCRCRFLVRYDHDQSEEIVPLRKVCRRPETDYRLQQLNAANGAAAASVSAEAQKPATDPTSSSNFMANTCKSNASASSEPIPPIQSSSAVTAPAFIPAQIPARTSVPVPVPPSVPVLPSVPDPVPVPALVPAPIPVSLSVSASVPVSASVQTPIPVLASTPGSVPVTVPAPDLAPVPTSEPCQVPVPAAVPVSVPGPVPASVPEVKHEESSSSGVLTGGTAIEANIDNSVGGTETLEPKMVESANDTSTVSIDPVSIASGAEKIVANNLENPELASSTATMTTGVDSSTVTASTKNVAE